MRRSERAVTDPVEIAGILERATVAHLAFLEDGRPAIVPMSFGFSREAERFVFYFHGSGEGRKCTCWRRDPRVALEVVGRNEFLLQSPACRSTCLYESVMAEGVIEPVTDPAAKARGLDLIMNHCGAPGPFDYPAAMLERTMVFRLVASEISGKSNRI